MPPSTSKSKPAKATTRSKAKDSTIIASENALIPLTAAKVSIRSKAKGSTAVASENDLPFTVFTLFPKLPGELQLIVWRNSHFPRIVTLKPSKSQFPPLLHACSDSRKECIKAGYQFWIRDMKTGFVMSPWQDVLLLDKTSFSASINYHINSFHTIQCRQVKLDMLEPIEKLAFSVHEVMEIWRAQCFHCFLLTKLTEVFPNLKELMIILRPGPLGASYDDLYEVKDCTSSYLKTAIVDVQTTFKNAQEEGSCKGIELKMMRVEKWIT
ncbi:hypothetical protein BKA61DRAFT_25820 [Leptodontidium sp. MPI-SDFR-AT-0119]|nr:hypothetical protein BKA61DRAFT_25820 [Leptodontidium sp. MPI-SDFR-AT-0119]